MSKTFDDSFEEVFKQDKKYVVQIYKPLENGDIEEFKLHYDEYPSFDEIKSWIADNRSRGMIEHINVLHEGNECDAIIDEEGKIYDLDVNPIATIMYDKFKEKHGYIVGNDLVVGTCAVLTNFELE